MTLKNISTISAPSAEKPILLLDVDGVCLPIGTPLPGHRSLNAYLWYMPELRDHLARLSQYFDIHWCTAWEYDANRLSPIFGLPQLPVCPMDKLRLPDGRCDVMGEGWHWKSVAIEDYVGDRPFAFVDDHIRFLGEAWAKCRERDGIPTKLIRVPPNTGLDASITDELIQWAKDNG